LRSTVAQGEVGQIERRRSVGRAGVHDLEHGLEIAIQITSRPRVALEGEELIALIPPPMRDATWQPYGFTRPKGQPLPIDLRRQRASGDPALFIFQVMNMQRRALPSRRQSAPESEHDFSVALLTSDLEDLAGMPVCQPQRHGSTSGAG
jgi:hypothetical protein